PGAVGDALITVVEAQGGPQPGLLPRPDRLRESRELPPVVCQCPDLSGEGFRRDAQVVGLRADVVGIQDHEPAGPPRATGYGPQEGSANPLCEHAVNNAPLRNRPPDLTHRSTVGGAAVLLKL